MRFLGLIFFLIFLNGCSHFETITKQTKSPDTDTSSVNPQTSAVITDQKVEPLSTNKQNNAANLSKTPLKPRQSKTKKTSEDQNNEVKLQTLLNQNDKDAISKSHSVKLPNQQAKESLPNYTGKQQDFAEYGFYTPDQKVEKLLNNELQSLRNSDSDSLEPDLLDRIRGNFQLDLGLENKRIDKQLAWYTKNPNYLSKIFNRSSKYLHHVVNEVESRDLPMELALLPFVESAYNPFAYSHGRASGLWQFIPGTGKMYGLDQDWWYDGRRDVLASTEAALDYLTYLNELFEGNWLHALAAYNSGEGRVRNAIKRNLTQNKNTDFWSLDLPKETRAYVPKLIALAQLVQDPEKYNIDFPIISDKPYFEKVDIGAQIDLAQAASLAGIDISEVYQLNPGFNQWASSPLGPHHLLVPTDKADIFRENLIELPPEKRIHWQRYTVKSGDSLIKIAKKFNTTPMLIKDINHLNDNTINVRQKLLIPTASEESSFYDLSYGNRLFKKQEKIQLKKGTDKLVYKVKSGDTIWDLSREHKVGVRELARWNGLAPTDPIKPGQKLVIWSKSEEVKPSNKAQSSIFKKREVIQKVGYSVRKGDSLARIAEKFNVSVKDLISWNKLDRKKYLKPGQKLTIFVDVTNT